MAKFIDLDTGLPALLNKVKAWVNSKLATKQDTIADLATIRTGAGKGATALQPADVSVETQGDGTVDINVVEDTYTINLNHTHENMAKVVRCEESDLPSSLDANTIYVQVDDDESPTEIEKLYICGLEFSAGEPDTTPRLISPAASTELDFNGASTLEVVVRGAYLTQALTITASGDFTVTANNSSVSSISANDANTGVTLTLTKGSNFVGGTLAISSTEVSRTVTVKSPLPEGFTANKAWNDTTLIDAAGYCISPVIAVSSGHTFEIKFGFVRGETQYGCAAGFQSNLSNGSAEVNVWASTDPRQREITYGFVCGTFKISEIDDCYIKDVTSNTYVWKGKNVT